MSSWAVIQQSLPMFEKGFQLTLWLSFVGIIGSIIVGIIVSLLQYFKVPVLHQVASIYVEVSRNTPLLIQLFFLYYAFPVIGIKFWCRVVWHYRIDISRRQLHGRRVYRRLQRRFQGPVGVW